VAVAFRQTLIWNALALVIVAGSTGCAEVPQSCEFEIAFDSDRDGSTEIYTLDLESLAVRQVTDFPDPRISNRFPDWSADGREIVFVSEDGSGIGNLFLVDADGSSLRKLTSDSARYENPAWSPQGDWIAFEKGLDADWGLYLIRPDGSGLQLIEGKNLFHPSWSPDGERLAIVTGDEHEWIGAIIDLDGTGQRRITPAGMDVGSVKWSPEGSQLAFDAVVDTNLDLFIVDETPSNLQRLTHSSAIDARPEWSPDGNKLVFHSTRDFTSVEGEDEKWQQFELYVMDLANKRTKRLTANEAFDGHPDWCPAP
jgi:Tol biopolymer transport system component